MHDGNIQMEVDAYGNTVTFNKSCLNNVWYRCAWGGGGGGEELCGRNQIYFELSNEE